MQTKLAIFDLDGTLAATLPSYWREKIPQLAKRFGVDCPPKEMFDAFWYENNNQDIFQRYFNTTPKQFWEAFRKLDDFGRKLDAVQLYHDADVLFPLKEKGLLLAICTSARRKAAESVANLFGTEFFDKIEVCNQYERFAAKPCPDGLLYIVRFFGLKNEEAIFVGNADDDLLAGKNAGIETLIVDRKEYKFNFSFEPKIIQTLYEIFDHIRA